eukprot:152193_1
MALLSRVPARPTYLVFGVLRVLEEICNVRVPNGISTTIVMFYYIDECFQQKTEKSSNILTLNAKWKTSSLSALGTIIARPQDNQHFIWRFRILSRPDSVRPPFRAFKIGIRSVDSTGKAINRYSFSDDFSAGCIVTMLLNTTYRSGELSYYTSDGNGQRECLAVPSTSCHEIHGYQLSVTLTSGYGGDVASIQLIGYFEH